MSTTAKNKLQVFLCRSSQDKPTVRELYQRLLAEAWLDPWLDEEKLLPGQDWNTEIEKAVEAADVVVVCLSKNSISKEGYVQRELKYVLDIALEKPEDTIFIIPLRFDNCEHPRRLRAWHYADYFPTSNREASLVRLLASLRTRALSISFDEDIKPTSNARQKVNSKNKALSLGKVETKDGLKYSKIANEVLVNEKLPNNVPHDQM